MYHATQVMAKESTHSATLRNLAQLSFCSRRSWNASKLLPNQVTAPVTTFPRQNVRGSNCNLLQQDKIENVDRNAKDKW